MAKYEKYAEYQDSGVEWLGEIPSHWTATALKRYARITDGSHHSPKIESEGFPFVSVTDVGINNINFVEAKKITENDYLRLVKEGCKPAVNDVLLTKDGTIGRACIVTEDMPDFVILSSLGLITPNKEISSQFLYYYLVSGINVDQMNSVIHGSALKRMTINKINDLIFTFPDFFEQEKIADFLDHETAKIDSLIAKQEKLIELLKEKRQAVISHAVTKGLNPDVNMKNSGVEWLGQVPESWLVTPLKYLIAPKRGAVKAGPFGSHLKNSDMEGEDIKVISQKNVIANDLSLGEAMISEKKYRELEVFTIEQEDILVTTRGTIGRTCVFKENFTAILHPCLIRLQVDHNKVIPDLIALIIQESGYEMEQILVKSNATTIEVIYSDNLINTVIVIPNNLEEQRQVLNYINNQKAYFNEALEKANYMIQKLRERRTALISSAVTGKIDVRNWQHPNKNNDAKTELGA